MSDEHRRAVAVIEQSGQIDRMHPVVRAAMAQTPTPETLRELLAIQREWEAGEAKRAFTRALVLLKAELPTVIARDQTVDFTGKSGMRTYYRHASLAGIMDAVTEPLARHGFSLSWKPSTNAQGVTVTCILTHSAGHSEDTQITAPVDNSGNKSPAQGVASTITLLQRYTALALLGIATADMPEQTAESEQPNPSAVDSARNLRAAAAVKKSGREVASAEAMLGRHVAEWTTADLDTLRSWLKQPVDPQ